VRPLVFTSALLDKARAGVNPLSPVLMKWAAIPGERGEKLRNQVERAAALIPEMKRTRFLGHLRERATFLEARAALGVLLLAKGLVDMGWSVEYEPLIGRQTPDLLIRRGSAEYLVEARRVVGRFHEGEREIVAFERLGKALEGVKTGTPIHVTHLSIDGRASLKPVVKHIREVLRSPPPEGPQSFFSVGVQLAYEVFDLSEEGEVLPALCGQQLPTVAGSDADRVKAAIDEKLLIYKQPIVVAVDLIGVAGDFGAVRDAFYGQRPIIVPVNLARGGDAGAPRVGPATGGMLVGRHRDALRARERLVAVLPFALDDMRTGPFRLRAQLLGNPAADPAPDFAEFAPIPRCVVMERTGREEALMSWEPKTGEPGRWRHTP
jgi:hypothetical protein